MCLILVAWKVHAHLPLVVAANRDEFHARPASRAAWWPDHPEILAGRDLQAKGTWLGISRGGRFASVTNYRGATDPGAAKSRGALVAGFLSNGSSPGSYARTVENEKESFSGFNLLVADQDSLWWLSNRGNGARKLEPGCYALGNLLLDSQEVMEVKARFERTQVALEPMFSLLRTAKIVAPAYGTRCSTVVLADGAGRMQFAERAFDAGGAEGPTLRYELGARA
jgi:uncharacterized protein with NRDE domain